MKPIMSTKGSPKNNGRLHVNFNRSINGSANGEAISTQRVPEIENINKLIGKA